jgi:sterol desaturase/sphingolipid hydroxylase (fatty acid hydroxylase superfamily)
MKRKTIKYVLINHLIVNPLYMSFIFLIAGSRSSYEGFPTHWEIIKFFAIAIVIDDFLYMLIHRLFHEVPSLYRYHKVHHEYESVFAYMNLYAHPVEHVIGNLVNDC